MPPPISTIESIYERPRRKRTGYYPDPVKWYLFSVSHYNEEYFIGIDSKLTLHIRKHPSTPYNPDIANAFYTLNGIAQ